MICLINFSGFNFSKIGSIIKEMMEFSDNFLKKWINLISMTDCWKVLGKNIKHLNRKFLEILVSGIKAVKSQNKMTFYILKDFSQFKSTWFIWWQSHERISLLLISEVRNNFKIIFAFITKSCIFLESLNGSNWQNEL